MQHVRSLASPPDGCPDSGLSVASMGLDAAELAVLTLQRHFFRSFAEPASQSWIQALTLGEECFPHHPRGEVALLVLTQVQALRQTRREVFRFSNPWCPGCSASLTRDELALVQLLRARTAEALAACASALSSQEANPALVIATTRLAEALSPIAPKFH